MPDPTSDYNRSGATFVRGAGTIIFFVRGVSEVGSTVHVQPMWPFLSKYQAPPPRFTISICQCVVFAGIVTANVSAAATITPQRIPNRNTRLILFFWKPLTLVGFSRTPPIFTPSIAVRSSRKCAETREPCTRFWQVFDRRTQRGLRKHWQL